MRSATLVLGLALTTAQLWSADAAAILPKCCTEEYTPAHYSAAANGDVAVNTATSTSFGQELVGAFIAPLGSTYVHAKEVIDSTGSTFVETFPSSAYEVPISYQTGEPNTCSIVVSPFYLARLGPGAGTYYEDAEPGYLVKAFATPSCTVPADSYNVASFMQPDMGPGGDSIPGGSCAKELVDYCGVPVQNYTYMGCFKDEATRDLPYNVTTIPSSSMQYATCSAACAAAGYKYAGVQDSSYCFCGNTYGKYGTATNCNMACSGDSGVICGGSYANSVYEAIGGDRAYYNSTQGFNSLNAAWSTVYQECLNTVNIDWIQSLACDGLTTDLACRRAAWQVVNEVNLPAYPLMYFGLEGQGYGKFAAGWSDYKVNGAPPLWGVTANPPPNYNVWTGAMLGGAKSNGEYYVIWNGIPTGINVVPGGEDDATTDNSPINSSAYVPSNFMANIPGNILTAANRLHKTLVAVNSTTGITAGYYTKYCPLQPPHCED
jgi:hypothetical protein